MITAKFSRDKTETCMFLYVSPFSVMSCIEALNLIYMCDQRPGFSYRCVQRFFIELNSYALPEVTGYFQNTGVVEFL